MYYHAQSNQYIYPGVFFNINGQQYDPSFLNTATPEELAALGLVPVTYVGERANDQYYWVSEEFNGPVITYVNTPKDINQVKALAIAQVNQTAYSLLFPSDWMVIKFVETQVPVAADWTTYRANVRTVAADTKTAITAATTVDEVATIMSSIVWPVNPDTPVQVPNAE